MNKNTKCQHLFSYLDYKQHFVTKIAVFFSKIFVLVSPTLSAQ